MTNPRKKGDWVTNHPKPFEGFWPRRAVVYWVGPPKVTEYMPEGVTEEQLAATGLIGIYLDEDLRMSYYSHEKVKDPAEYKFKLRQRQMMDELSDSVAELAVYENALRLVSKAYLHTSEWKLLTDSDVVMFLEEAKRTAAAVAVMRRELAKAGSPA
jgi:hypothetical protein